MAYGSLFPTTYQPMYYSPPAPQVPQPVASQPMTTQTQQPMQNQNSIVWVQGEAGAKSYLLAPNTTMPLWDSETQTIYLKSTDASGMPTIKYLDYKVRESSQPVQTVVDEPTHSNHTTNYATKEEIADLTTEVLALKRRLDSISHRSTRRKETKSDE